MVTLMRRAGGFDRTHQLDYANMRPTYRKHVRGMEIRTLTEFITRVAELEGIEQEERTEKAEKRTPRVVST